MKYYRDETELKVTAEAGDTLDEIISFCKELMCLYKIPISLKFNNTEICYNKDSDETWMKQYLTIHNESSSSCSSSSSSSKKTEFFTEDEFRI